MATIHQRNHMHSIGTALHEKIIQVIITNHTCRGKVTRAEGFVITVSFFSVIIVTEFGSVA